VRQLK
jgi:hypothetical protein